MTNYRENLRLQLMLLSSREDLLLFLGDEWVGMRLFQGFNHCENWSLSGSLLFLLCNSLRSQWKTWVVSQESSSLARPGIQTVMVFSKVQFTAQDPRRHFWLSKCLKEKSCTKDWAPLLGLPSVWDINPTNLCCLRKLNTFKLISLVPSRLSSCSNNDPKQANWPLLEMESLHSYLTVHEQTSESYISISFSPKLHMILNVSWSKVIINIHTCKFLFKMMQG